jgi:hypothetical protein
MVDVSYPYFADKKDIYKKATNILNSFSLEPRYLRNLVTMVTQDKQYVKGLSYNKLLHEGIKIRQVAEKIKETTKNKPRKRKEGLETKITDPIEIISNSRYSSLNKGNYARYSAICDYTGIVADDSVAYEKGKADGNYEFESRKIDLWYSSLIRKSYERDSYKEAVLSGEFDLDEDDKTKKKFFSRDFVPTTVKALRLEIKRVYDLIGEESPKGLSKMKLGDLNAIYWKLRKTYSN